MNDNQMVTKVIIIAIIVSHRLEMSRGLRKNSAGEVSGAKKPAPERVSARGVQLWRSAAAIGKLAAAANRRAAQAHAADAAGLHAGHHAIAAGLAHGTAVVVAAGASEADTHLGVGALALTH